ncbi:MAG: hypothetical protein M1829_005837 [Trizodia sp. TS-e1964]|nr:MAG: hypothetical protein M1829_005837 [Trizodia sp. TS-e1964]
MEFPINVPKIATEKLSKDQVRVFPSSYRSTEQQSSTSVSVEGELDQNPSRTPKVAREGHHNYSFAASLPSKKGQTVVEEEDIHVYTEAERSPRPRRREEFISIEETRRAKFPELELARDRTSTNYREPFARYAEAQFDVAAPRQQQQQIDQEFERSSEAARYPETRRTEVEIDRVERSYRQRTQPSYVQQRDYRVAETVVEPPRPHKHSMGYYDEDGNYHSFRRGLERAADRVLHPLHGHHHHHHQGHSQQSSREEIVVAEERPQPLMDDRSPSRSGPSGPPNSITIPCHHIRIGDLLILQGRPCQVIRITTSAQTGQHRYLGVDLFTKQLHEESSFISNPSPSVVVQNMLGPVFKQYRVLDIREDGYVVAMTESGDIKQGLPVIDQSNLLSRLNESFANGRGSVRVLVINDNGRELAVDYKVVHGSRL